MAGLCEGLAVSSNGDEVDVECGVVVQADVGGGKGRGLVATRHFRKGETLFKEKPIVSAQFCWNECSGYKSCHHCLEPLETTQENVIRLTGDPTVVLPLTAECCPTKPDFHTVCPQSQVTFCCNNCMRDALDSYHQILAPILGQARLDPRHPFNVLQEAWKKIHYPPETASITLLVRILATIAQRPSPEESEELAQKYLTTFAHSAQELQLNVCHKLLGEQFAEQLETLRLATAKLFGHVECQALQWFLSPEGFASLFAMVGRNGQGIGTSPFSQYVKRVENLSRLKPKEREEVDSLIDVIYGAIENFAGMQFIDSEGSGLYWMHSAANHSCVPNAVVEFPFNNHELVMTAATDISPGEEILISYLDGCQQNQSRHSRQKYLRENYLFTCQCPKCAQQSGDPDVTSDEEMDSSEEEEEDQDEQSD